MLPLRHFSAEVVERCLHLYETLSPLVAAETHSKVSGPLNTTFLLAMAMPLIVIPMERIADNQRVTGRRPARRRDAYKAYRRPS